ncbi:MAG: hypothetical protein JW829_13675, partial [Pirellulales bacterium]|nr:hypothetical protein [Pirellulales bacterium]
MSTVGPTRTRSQRVASVGQQPSWWWQLWIRLKEPGVFTRLMLCAAAAMVLFIFSRGWAPPRTFYKGQIPERHVIARTPFTQIDQEKTR